MACWLDSRYVLLCSSTCAHSSGYISDLSTAGGSGLDFSAVDDILEKGVSDKVTPGLVAIVGAYEKWLYSSAKGNRIYNNDKNDDNKSENDALHIDSGFDLASLTKVVATTAAVAQLFEEGLLDLDEKLSSEDLLGSLFSQNGKQNITIRQCLTHKAGFPPDPIPDYWSESFGCPQAKSLYDELSFSCSEKIFASLLRQELTSSPGEKYVYSDLSFISLMYVVGTVVIKYEMVDDDDVLPSCLTSSIGRGKLLQCAFEAYFRKFIVKSMSHVCSKDVQSNHFCGMESTTFVPGKDKAHAYSPTSVPRVMPDSGRILEGVVEDGNAAAMGGIAGHAGLFSNAPDLANYAHAWLFPSKAGLLNETTAELFRAVVDDIKDDPYASSRALGWNTNDPLAFDHGWNFSCGSLSSTTFLHIGYTGTQICIDPIREIYTVLLTNRVYPVDDPFNGIRSLRKEFNTAVASAVDHGPVLH